MKKAQLKEIIRKGIEIRNENLPISEDFKSKAQQKYLYSTNPEAAKKLDSKMTKKDYKNLPDKVSEGNQIPVSKEDWGKADSEQRVDWLLQIFDDPDKAEKYFETEWEDLPNEAPSNMYLESVSEKLKSTENYAGSAATKSTKEYLNQNEKDSVDEEMDINDPVLVASRAAKMRTDKILSQPQGDEAWPTSTKVKKDNSSKIAFLEKEREQLMMDMEQEAEPEGGTIADRYGAQLNRIDKAIAKLSGRQKMTYDQAIAESVNEGFTKKEWDVEWKMPKDNLFNATKTIDAVKNRFDAIQGLLKLNPEELQAFENNTEHPAYDMSYDELMRWYYQIMKEPVNENVPDDGDVYGWYWPIADKAMERLKRDSKYSEASLGAVGSGDGSTYISITVDFPSGSEEHFDVFFNGEEGNEQVTNIESTFVSEGKKPVNEADKYVDARGNFKLRKGLEVKIKSADEIKKLNISEDYMKYNLQIAGQTVKIERAFRGVFGGAPSEFTVKGYEAFETRSTGKPRVGFTQSIIGSVTGSDVVRESRTSTISKKRAQAELKQKLKGTRSDGMGKYTATVYGLDKDGKRVELKSMNNINKYSKFELGNSGGIDEAELYGTEKKKLKNMAKSLKKSSKGHAAQAKYLTKLVKESLNPEVYKSVDRFIKAMAAKYGYEEEDALFAIRAALKEREYNVDVFGSSMEINEGHSLEGKDLDLLKSLKSEIDQGVLNSKKKDAYVALLNGLINTNVNESLPKGFWDKKMKAKDEGVSESYATLVNKIEKSGKSKKASKAIAGAVASYKAKGGGKGPTAKQSK